MNLTMDIDEYRQLRGSLIQFILEQGFNFEINREIKDLNDIQAEIICIFRHIRENSLITKFRTEAYEGKGPLTDMLCFMEKTFGTNFIEECANIYEIDNPLLVMLKRENQKPITLAKFLKEVITPYFLHLIDFTHKDCIHRKYIFHTTHTFYDFQPCMRCMPTFSSILKLHVDTLHFWV